MSCRLKLTFPVMVMLTMEKRKMVREKYRGPCFSGTEVFSYIFFFLTDCMQMFFQETEDLSVKSYFLPPFLGLDHIKRSWRVGRHCRATGATSISLGRNRSSLYIWGGPIDTFLFNVYCRVAGSLPTDWFLPCSCCKLVDICFGVMSMDLLA